MIRLFHQKLPAEWGSTFSPTSTVFDLLEHPVQILHYMMKREAVEASVGYLADELDLLGLYLTTLLNIGDVEPDVELTLPAMSAPLDTYYNSLDAGVTLDKPRPATSPLFASIFSQLNCAALPDGRRSGWPSTCSRPTTRAGSRRCWRSSRSESTCMEEGSQALLRPPLIPCKRPNPDTRLALVARPVRPSRFRLRPSQATPPSSPPYPECSIFPATLPSPRQRVSTSP